MRAHQFSKADAIICPSESSRSDLHEFYDVPESKTHVIHHGVTSLPVPSTSDPLIAGRPFLLYVGSRAPYKNFGEFLRAFAAAGLNEEFCILALGGKSATKSEQNLISELSLRDSVRFLPNPSDEYLARAYKQAHLLVYPSLYEGFGFPPLEAMSLACPVLAAHVSSLPEICGNATFYFNPKDRDSFVDQLKTACFDEPGRRAKVERGIILAKTYVWERCAAETLRLYEG
jgi:glycosyltransferase involved in cell wall biosynthesis